MILTGPSNSRYSMILGRKGRKCSVANTPDATNYAVQLSLGQEIEDGNCSLIPVCGRLSGQDNDFPGVPLQDKVG